MRNFGLAPVAAAAVVALAMTSISSPAQNDPNSAPAAPMTAPPNPNAMAPTTSPDTKVATGPSSPKTSAASISDQPLTATGLDLKGPPVRYSSGTAPE